MPDTPPDPTRGAQTPDIPMPLVFQFHEQPAQCERLDPEFVPVDLGDSQDPLALLELMRQLSTVATAQQAPLWGLVSWRFFDATGCSGEDLQQLLAEQPGADVYVCNPAPEAEALYANPWQHALAGCPGFREACACVFEAAGIDAAEFDALQPAQAFVSGTHVLGRAAFWQAWLRYLDDVVARARAGLPASVCRWLDRGFRDQDAKSAFGGYWPRIIDCLLPLFLRGPGAGLQVHRIAAQNGTGLRDEHLLCLRALKDAACRERSAPLLACWVQYRKLYLDQSRRDEHTRLRAPATSPGAHLGASSFAF